jgi:hypothetical protein
VIYKTFHNISLNIADYFYFIIFCAILQLVTIIGLSCNANAQIIDSKFYDWSVYEFQENEFSYKKCYIVSHPLKTDSDDNSRKKPYLMIARYQKNRSEEVSVFGGFDFKMSSEIFMIIDAFQFHLKAKGDMAWARSKHEDISIIETLLNGAVVKIRSDSAYGTYAIDEYSLKGITLAYLRMKEICR